MPKQNIVISLFIYFIKVGVLFEVMSAAYVFFIAVSNKVGAFSNVTGVMWAIMYALIIPLFLLLSLLGAKFIPFAKLETENWGIATLFILNIPLVFIFVTILFPTFLYPHT